MEQKKDSVMMNNKKWEFDENVTEAFDNMLERSIPEYMIMRELVTKIGKNYVQFKTGIVDIGCSNGNAIYPFIKKFGAQNTYKLYDVSKPMLAKCRERYKNWEEIGLMEISEYDLRQGVNLKNVSLVLSILTLQFTPIEFRHKIVKSIYDSLNVGGAFILVEKVLGNTCEIDEVFVKEYYELKKENEYTQEQIEDKRKSLEGVLVPIADNWNVDLLKSAGFKQIDSFWKCLNFVGYIAIK